MASQTNRSTHRRLPHVASGFAVALVLAGCASTSDVTASESDLFTITSSASQSRGGEAAAKRRAYRGAAAECARQGQKPLVVALIPTAPSITEVMATATLKFKCVWEGANVETTP